MLTMDLRVSQFFLFYSFSIVSILSPFLTPHKIFNFKVNWSKLPKSCLFKNINVMGRESPNFGERRVEVWENRCHFFPKSTLDFSNSFVGGRTLHNCYILNIRFH